MPRKCGSDGAWYQGSEKGERGRETRMWNVEDKFYLSQILFYQVVSYKLKIRVLVNLLINLFISLDNNTC